MSHRRYCILVGLCLVVLSIAACGGGAAQPAAAPTTASSAPTQPTAAPVTKASLPTALPTVEPTTEPTAEAAQPAAMSGTKIDMNNPIFKAYYAVYNKFPRRMRAEAFDTQTNKTTTILMETDAKDHLHLEIGGLSAADGLTMSVVIISPTTYLKQGATWQKLPDAASGALTNNILTNADFLQQVLNAFGELANYTVTPLGPDNVNGVPAMAYSSEFTLKDGKVSKGKAWIGPDGLLIGDHIETSDGSVITMTYDFDSNIKVEAPIP